LIPAHDGGTICDKAPQGYTAEEEEIMAAKKPAAKSSAKRKVSAKKTGGSALDRIIDAGLDEAGIAGWRTTTMEAIASRANVELGEALILVPTKAHFVLRLMDRVDAQTLAGVKRVESDDTPRDRLFEIVMRRFDALNRHRDGFKSVIYATARDPVAAPLALCRVRRSMAMMLAAAGISVDGLKGLIRIKGLAAVGAYALRAWMKDDSADLAKTMAALDRALAQAERVARFSPFRRREKSSEAAT
jgi:hypothetical protein